MACLYLSSTIQIYQTVARPVSDTEEVKTLKLPLTHVLCVPQCVAVIYVCVALMQLAWFSH